MIRVIYWTSDPEKTNLWTLERCSGVRYAKGAGWDSISVRAQYLLVEVSCSKFDNSALPNLFHEYIQALVPASCLSLTWCCLVGDFPRANFGVVEPIQCTYLRAEDLAERSG